MVSMHKDKAARGLGVIGLLALCAPAWAAPAAACERTLRAEVVALEQAMVLNRYGAFNPAGMLYALQRDVVFHGHPQIADGTPVVEANLAQAPGHVQLRADKRPRPLVLRANEGDCMEVRFHNLLMPGVPDERHSGPEQYGGAVPAHLESPLGTLYNRGSGSDTGRELVMPQAISNDLPHTRAAAFHVNGLDVLPVPAAQCPLSTATRQWVCGTDGDNVGLNLATVNPATPQPLRSRLEQQAGQVYPGQSALYRMRAFREGTYFAYSTGATVGGEGDGGQLGAGLFGAVNVQPRGAKWYRSQVTQADLYAAARPVAAGHHPYSQLDYDGARYNAGPRRGLPVLAMLDGNEIVHSDLNAIVVLTGPTPDRHDTTSAGKHCKDYVFGTSCGQTAYREFTVIMHDEVKAVQAFAELEDPDNPLHYIKDGMGINYGVGGMGAMVVARNRRTGPVKDCPECRAEEFFLSSWASGDPALVLRWDASGKQPVGAMYPDDPSNVHHSYLSDPVRFRNIHAGPKETHVFHLHAHQWVMDASAPGSTYLDSQTISPGATFSYEIEFGGSGNRNLTPGDSIFHCHLYPHFAQGMWELWRTHDVFEDGSAARKLPDAEVAGGTENPALVPLPGTALALMPSESFAGYPFYVAGVPGHRPPQPPLDMDVDGGLPRHVITGWEGQGNRTVTALANQDVMEAALSKGSLTAQINARRVRGRNQDPSLMSLAEEWSELGGMKLLAQDGEPAEKLAMSFHAGTLSQAGYTPVSAPLAHPEWDQTDKAYVTDRAVGVAGQTPASGPAYFHVNGRAPVAGAPFADPCPEDASKNRLRHYKVGVIQTELTVNRHGWFDPQARILALEQDIQDIIDPNTRDRLPEPLFFRANSGDCINFKHSNFVPNALALDDFQIYTPTDTIGQHIHLVKFDVTSSDGSGNGWNYEDGTFSPEEVRERVLAYNVAAAKRGAAPLSLKTHPLFERACAAGDSRCAALQQRGTCPPDAARMSLKELAEKHPFCGAQRTVQRWYADPIFDPKNGKDYTLRTVFTHDHFGPSSHQQHGLYAALIIEPSNSVWLQADAQQGPDFDLLCDGTENAPGVQNEAAKLLGGANLSSRYNKATGRCEAQPTGTIAATELRPPLVLRDDGGPTSVRASIVAPECLSGLSLGGSRKNSNPLAPGANTQCPVAQRSHDSRREYALAIADFAILYNTALEPINPETRDTSALRVGRRQVALNVPRPLAISSEDPGTQLINYRNEPIPLRVADRTPDPLLGGFSYRQTPCEADDLQCSGDMANAFSSSAHAQRDLELIKQPYGALLSPTSREVLSRTPVGPQVDQAMASVEQWRRDFSCALYPETALSNALCRPGIQRKELLREMGDPATPILPAYEKDNLYVRLIQGAQEAQHVFTMSAMKWLKEPDNPRSGLTNAQPLGISEHFEFDIKPAPLAVDRVDSLYGGSSIDQLWDGQWGLVRSYKDPATRREREQRRNETERKSGRPLAEASERTADRDESDLARRGLVDLQRQRQGKGRGGDQAKAMAADVAPSNANLPTQVCAIEDQGKTYKERLYFEISAVRACELTQSCGQPGGARGIPYNQRMGMTDPQGIVYVRNNKLPGAPEPNAPPSRHESNAQVLVRLQEEFAQGLRRMEPLVLRAPAGACMELTLRNHLPPQLGDGPLASGEHNDALASDNFMSMILDGFNYNQMRTSSSVGLSAPMLSRLGLVADGANFGLNAEERRRTHDAEAAELQAHLVKRPGRQATPLGATGPAAASSRPVAAQANLTPACRPGDPDHRCTSSPMLWYAGEHRLDANGVAQSVPIEFGALPLSSYGDVFKHAAHGAIGALVIGPEGSRVCASDDPRERLADQHTDTSATICTQHGPYREFVLALQDAVDARIHGDRVPNLKGAEEPDDYGVKAANYRSEPLWARRGGDPSIEFEERNEFEYGSVLSSKAVRNVAPLLPAPEQVPEALRWLISPTYFDTLRPPVTPQETDQLLARLGEKEAAKQVRCQAGVPLLAQDGRHACDPETPLFVAQAGREVRLRVVHPGGHTRQQAFTVHGHDWDPAPWNAGPPLANRASQTMRANHAAAMADAWTVQGTYNSIGPMMAANLLMKAGGRAELPMDYLWRSQASFVYDGGIWGLMRVLPKPGKEPKP